MTLTEADTCRQYVVPKLYAANWTDDQINEQRTFTAGRIIVAGKKAYRLEKKRVDYLLRYRRDFPIAVVEAKRAYKKPGDGLQQAKEYAKLLRVRFAYATNGTSIVEHDFTTGKDNDLDAFPSPDELWQRLRRAEGVDDYSAERLLTPCNQQPNRQLRYYQEIAINSAVESILKGKKRVLLTLATGTGKTEIAFQLAWKLWNSYWNPKREHRRPRILFLSDRSVLVDDPKDKTFTPFGHARWKMGEGGKNEPVMSREMYFALYQSIARDEARPGLYKEYPRDFFDLIIVDECHRGSARDESNWREILEYYQPAFQVGMTATPLREDNRDTYRYFGNPIYTYSLRQGIEDGFLAPYRVFRVLTSVDAAGWRPTKGEMDRFGRAIPDEQYETKDFERIIALKARTDAMARHLTNFLTKTDRLAKTIIFCVDQEHAEEMRKAINNLNADLAREHPDYVCRIVSEEGDIGRGYLSKFQELETTVPVIVTTSKLLTTGVDVQTCKNIVIARVIGSMTEFKQIIGRGTRVREDYGKLWFNIIDYTGSATRLFADPDFDGEPARISEEQMTDTGEVVPGSERVFQEDKPPQGPLLHPAEQLRQQDGGDAQPRKYYVDKGSVEVLAEYVSELDSSGKKLRVVKFVDYAAEKVREMATSANVLRSRWTTSDERRAILNALAERGVTLEHLQEVSNQQEADPFDLLCHVAFNAPLKTRYERAQRLLKGKKDFWDRYAPEAQEILREIIGKYVDHGVEQLSIPEILKVPPISDHGNVMEITGKFGGPDNLRNAVNELQALIYAA